MHGERAEIVSVSPLTSEAIETDFIIFIKSF